MTAIIVQCRLSSTRLPRKALKELGGKSVLEWTLNSMKKINADSYFVATDEDSFAELEPVAKKCGWEIFAGPRDDVLERFCLLIEKIKADVVIRATADNPFLFYEAASALLEEYEKEKPDYITWTGLPHGSGVEIFNAHSLLEAKKSTSSEYDHEHVGPALYNHKDKFNCLFIKSPARWYYPEFRTTIDTYADYARAQLIFRSVNSDGAGVTEPFTTEQIVSALNKSEIQNMILLVPCVKKGKGTGHLLRCLKIAADIGATVYIPQNANLKEKDSLIQNAFDYGLEPWQITDKWPSPGEYGLIFTDAFELEKKQAYSLHKLAPVVSLDEGSEFTSCCDYLLNVIPPINEDLQVNLSDSRFIELPQNRRNSPRPRNAEEIKKVLISIGGEDPLSFAIPASIAFARLGKHVTTIKKGITNSASLIPNEFFENLEFLEPVDNLKEKLFKYDLVVTHYGLTAYEASAAGCAVLLVGTSPLHVALAQKYGFVCLRNFNMSSQDLNKILDETEFLYSYPEEEIPLIQSLSLSSFVRSFADAKRLSCPVCSKSGEKTDVDSIVARTPLRTFRRCSECGMIYMSFNRSKDMNYDKNYFADQYKNQYGKTYLEDFESIKKQCVRRVNVISSICGNKKYPQTSLFSQKESSDKRQLSVLDVGCAYGPFLSAAFDSGYKVYGTDISQDAVDYVRTKLNFPSACSAFPDFNPLQEFGVNSFDAVTMWFVIEHFKNLEEVLKAVNKLLKTGGIFAFSTPSASGVSARFNREKFFEQSPSDHFTLWEIPSSSDILSRFGFNVEKIISTGHHAERFPLFEKFGWKKGSIPYKLLNILSRLFKLGDTFEVYCRKIR